MARNKKEIDSDSLVDNVSSPWTKFLEKREEVKSLPTTEWKASHLLAYFLNIYKDYYKIDYSLKLNAVPSKCYEAHTLKKLGMMLSSNIDVLKEYIDWIFKHKVQDRKKRITSIGYLATVELVNEFKFKVLLAKNPGAQDNIDRETKLPDNYLNVITKTGLNISTYGELSFADKIASSGNNSYMLLFEELKKAGFSTDLLLKVK